MKKFFVFSLFALTTYQLFAMEQAAIPQLNKITVRNSSDLKFVISLLQFGKSTPDKKNLSGAPNPESEYVSTEIEDLPNGNYHLIIGREISYLPEILHTARILVKAKANDQTDKVVSEPNEKPNEVFWSFNIEDHDMLVTLVPEKPESVQRRIIATLHRVEKKAELAKVL